jgi:hypothetical protein
MESISNQLEILKINSQKIYDLFFVKKIDEANNLLLESINLVNELIDLDIDSDEFIKVTDFQLLFYNLNIVINT